MKHFFVNQKLNEFKNYTENIVRRLRTYAYTLSIMVQAYICFHCNIFLLFYYFVFLIQFDIVRKPSKPCVLRRIMLVHKQIFLTISQTYTNERDTEKIRKSTMFTFHFGSFLCLFKLYCVFYTRVACTHIRICIVHTTHIKKSKCSSVLYRFI